MSALKWALFETFPRRPRGSFSTGYGGVENEFFVLRQETAQSMGGRAYTDLAEGYGTIQKPTRPRDSLNKML